MCFQTWQRNAVVKDDGGAGGLTECSASLKRWMFSRPEMACVIIDFKDESIAHCTGVQKIFM